MAANNRSKTLKQNGVQIVKIGGTSNFLDFYYRMMEISWPYFVSIVTVAFFAINLFFGLVYAWIGGINNAAPNSIID
ncbi:MAG: potassium channel protein, partial [Hyphomonadaceae bacterium]